MGYFKTSILTFCAVLFVGSATVHGNTYSEPNNATITIESRQKTRPVTNMEITSGLNSLGLLELDDVSAELRLALTEDTIYEITPDIEAFVLQVLEDISSEVTFDTDRTITGRSVRFSRILVHAFNIQDDEIANVYSVADYIGPSGVFSLEVPLYVGDNVLLLVSIAPNGIVIFGSYIDALSPEIRVLLESRRPIQPSRPT